MELRHLRYFIAVAEEGSLTLAAEKKLHTAQPSLSRQIRDLEHEVGAELMTRSVRGIELTAAGKAFLDHVRLALAQVDAAVEAAGRAAQPGKKTFAIGVSAFMSFTNFRRRLCQPSLDESSGDGKSHPSPIDSRWFWLSIRNQPTRARFLFASAAMTGAMANVNS
jgi:DNA-binding transcriptional LysR family regulator